MTSKDSKMKPGKFDYIIVGAGPAGLQMGYFLMKKKRSYIILENKDIPGSFFRKHPVHRTLISLNKRFNPFPEPEYNMRHDWNSLLSDDPELRFTKYSKELFPHADDIVRYMNDYATKLDLNICYNTRVEKIKRLESGPNSSENFSLRTTKGEYRCKVLLMATGARSERIPDHIKGKELMETYSTHDVNPEKYNGKSVFILGNGNSAFEAANNLAGSASLIHIFGDRKLKHAWDTHFVGDLRAVNDTILDMYQLKSLHVYQALDLLSVEKTDKGFVLTCDDIVPHWKERQGHVQFELPPYDHVICCTGFNYIDLSIFDDNCKPDTKKNGKFPSLSNIWESSIPNMFYMGTTMQCNDRKAASGFIHGFRYNIRTLHSLLEERYEDLPYPRDLLPIEIETLADKIVERVSVGDGIYQMNNALCHVLAIPDFADDMKGEVKAEFYQDFPKPYALEAIENGRFSKYKHVFLIVLAYGFEDFGDAGKYAMEFVHFPDLATGDCQAFLHPVITYYKDGQEIDKLRLPESLVLRFDIPLVRNQNPVVGQNRMKNYINKHLTLQPGKHFYDKFFMEKMSERVTPFTSEEINRIPNLKVYKGCIPFSIDFMSAS
ncbi:FAD-dependent oxidoreductase domain-containing protein 2-like [Saccoglossus kowalevskii]|uniref:FAD-dependent oxidoreductase domain-containing protein 2-like n=1 Tax=Saccoglossus kowalevskii TaxID=10224 RepID=A0ABM0M6P8_SACKO|nr:PREDICTED: FAD-dependent oxidoreductase domain-containing protein 2-like [Saccoglossus kowalevskii]